MKKYLSYGSAVILALCIFTSYIYLVRVGIVQAQESLVKIQDNSAFSKKMATSTIIFTSESEYQKEKLHWEQNEQIIKRLDMIIQLLK